MAKIIKTQLSKGTGSAEAAVAFINSLNSSFITARMDGTKSIIEINSVFRIENITVDNGARVYKNDTLIWEVYRGYTKPYVTIVYDEDIAYMWVWTSSGGDFSFVSFGLIYKKIGDKDLYGFYSGSGSTSNIANFPLYDENTGVEYSINTVFKDYSPNLNSIDYTSSHLFQSTIKQSEEIPDFLDCSLVPSFSVITFEGKNYFALGPHTLVLLDEE